MAKTTANEPTERDWKRIAEIPADHQVHMIQTAAGMACAAHIPGTHIDGEILMLQWPNEKPAGWWRSPLGPVDVWRVWFRHRRRGGWRWNAPDRDLANIAQYAQRRAIRQKAGWN